MRLEEFEKIFVLVSGGIDSTYLYEKLKKFYKEKVYPVNCYNPYENNKTLRMISEDQNYIQIKPDKKYNYGEILRNAFLRLPEARKLREKEIEYNKKHKRKKTFYHKKIFPCCYHIKHKGFFNDPLFKEPNTVVISGIKHGDGSQRAAFLSILRKGSKYIGRSKTPNNIYYLINGKEKPTFFHRHKGGQLYCYPFRDYFYRELSDVSIRRLRRKYPNLKHSGCSICPVLVLFDIKKEGKRYINSINYTKKLGVL